MSQYSAILLGIALSMSVSLAYAEQQSTLADQTAISVTIYNENLALIKDKRQLTLDTGINALAFRGVSANMRPETALLRSEHADGLRILEQNFDFDLLTPQKLLEKYVGKQIQIARMNPATGKESIETATVLSTVEGTVVKIDDRIETNPLGRFIFDNVPANLRDQPTLVTQISNKTKGSQEVELSYLTGGLSWKADYVAELNANDSQLDLTGWITLTNQSGTAYNNAKLQLVAGDVNQVQPERVKSRIYEMRSEMAAPMADGAVSEEALFEYHLYSLPRETNLADKQTKQVSLLSAQSVPVTKQLLLQGANYYYLQQYGEIGRKMKVGVFVEFENTKADGLGLPLPKGIVRVYKNDSQNNAQFIGEDRIDHTAKNDTIRLKLGDAFDVTGTKVQTDFKQRPHAGRYHNAYSSSFELTLNNAKSEPVTVTVREPIPGEWQMLKETHPHSEVSSSMAEWQITIPAESKQTLSYQVEVKY
jgi:hypothetical protein